MRYSKFPFKRVHLITSANSLSPTFIPVNTTPGMRQKPPSTTMAFLSPENPSAQRSNTTRSQVGAPRYRTKVIINNTNDVTPSYSLSFARTVGRSVVQSVERRCVYFTLPTTIVLYTNEWVGIGQPTDQTQAP